MRIRMKVAAVELVSDTAALVKLYPVKEQPEPELFPGDPQASFAFQTTRERLVWFPIGKEYDLFFALPAHEIPAEEKADSGPKLTKAQAKPGEAVKVTNEERRKAVRDAIEESRKLGSK